MAGTILLAPKTAQQIDSVVARKPHALMIVGPKGSGRTTIALHLAAHFIGIADDQIEAYPYLSVIRPDGASVKIEQVKAIKNVLRLQTPETGKPLRRFIIVESADTMTREAQNAALKFIEEPPTDTVIMLLIENERDLLQTIRSRCGTLAITTPSEADATTYAAQELQVDAARAAQNYKLSGGRIGLFLALLTEKDHPLVRAMERAKSLLGAPKFERLIQVDELTKDKELAKNILFALDRIAHAGLAIPTATPAQAKRWLGILQAVEQAESHIHGSVSSKLVFTNLMLAL